MKPYLFMTEPELPVVKDLFSDWLKTRDRLVFIISSNSAKRRPVL